MHNKRKTLKELFYHKFPTPYFLLIGYVVFRVISNLFYITKYSFAAKTILEIVFEQILLVLAFFLLSPTKDEIETLIKVIVWTAFALFIMGIVESLTSFRIFDCLYIVNRNILNEHYIRMGLLRATTTMGLAGMYSNMCLLVLPLVLYLYNKTMQKRYLFVCFACLLAAIHSGSRSFFFYLLIIFIYYYLFVLRSKPTRIRCFRNAIILAVSICFFAIFISLFSPTYKYFYEGSIKAILNELGMDYDLNANAPEGVNGYGVNYESTYKFQGGVASRRIQFSGISYVLNINPIFGLGNGAQYRNEIYYYFSDHWQICRNIDVGLVEIIINEGLLGLLGFLLLFVFMISTFIHSNTNKLSRNIGIMLIICYILTTLSTTNMMHFLLLILLYVISANKYSYNDQGHIYE